VIGRFVVVEPHPSEPALWRYGWVASSGEVERHGLIRREDDGRVMKVGEAGWPTGDAAVTTLLLVAREGAERRRIVWDVETGGSASSPLPGPVKSRAQRRRRPQVGRRGAAQGQLPGVLRSVTGAGRARRRSPRPALPSTRAKRASLRSSDSLPAVSRRSVRHRRSSRQR
jgi:hypothetical protein